MSNPRDPLLPPNQTPLEAGLSLSMQTQVNPDVIRSLPNPMTCPIALLPYLAWALSVDEWDNQWSEHVKRQVVADSVQVHRIKGTLRSVKQAIETLDLSASIKEWWQESPTAPAHTFKVRLHTNTYGITAKQCNDAEAQIRAAKPVRSQFTLLLDVTAQANLYVALAIQDQLTTSVYPQ